MWDSASFVVGIMIGLIIMLVVVWSLYTSRTFIFNICPKSSRICRLTDYINLPGIALADGAEIQDILFLREDGLYYKRVPRVPGCIPLPATQTVKVRYPQYCNFTLSDGGQVEGRQTQPGSPVYAAQLDGQPLTVMSNGNCGVERATPDVVVSGKPLLRWDPASLNEDLSSTVRN